MNKTWPDRELALLQRYVADLDLTGVHAGKPYESVLRRFQRFAMDCAPKRPLDKGTLQAWLRQCMSESTLGMAVRRAQLVTRFLDWLVANSYLPRNPFHDLREPCRRQSTAAIVRALVSPDPDSELKSLHGLPGFGSHLGPIMREHVERMKTLGFRYDEARFRKFDEFLQQRTGARNESLTSLVEEYAKLASTPASYMERVKVGRLIARSLQRTNPMTPDYMQLVVGHSTSGAEEIAKMASGAKVIKAFNHVYAQIIHSSPEFGNRKANVFIAGDDAEA